MVQCKGIGKPEPLKYRSGYSRRIDDANRLVYEIDELQNIKNLIMQRGIMMINSSKERHLFLSVSLFIYLKE